MVVVISVKEDMVERNKRAQQLQKLANDLFTDYNIVACEDVVNLIYKDPTSKVSIQVDLSLMPIFPYRSRNEINAYDERFYSDARKLAEEFESKTGIEYVVIERKPERTPNWDP